VSGPLRMPDWNSLSAAAPQIAGTMRRYLIQLECALRTGSVRNADQALRAFAAFLIERHPTSPPSPR
jgi:hypothetical protein